VLDGVMEAIDLGGDENAEKRLNVLRAIDKLDRLGVEGVRELLGEGRVDDSGDRAEGVGLGENVISILLALLLDGNSNGWLPMATSMDKNNIPVYEIFTLQQLQEIGVTEVHENLNNIIGHEANLALGLIQAVFINQSLEIVSNQSAYEGFSELFFMAKQFKNANYDHSIKIDPTCVRGLEYYTGPVFEAELTFKVKNEKGQEVVFGSVGGGGRYDGLVSRFMGQPVPATGFSIGVSRLMSALKNNGLLDKDKKLAPVLVTVMDGDAMGQYQSYVQALRNAGIRAEMYQGNWKKFPNQLRYADKRGCPIAIIQGSDEREAGKIQLKDMIEGKKEAAAIESNEEYRAARPGQKKIDSDQLVDEVKAMLAEQAKE